MIGRLLVGPYFLSLAGILPAESDFSGSYKQAFGTFHFFTFAFLGLVAFGIGEDIDFGSPDGEPADIAFPIVSPETSSGKHLQMLAAIAVVARKEENRQALRHAHDAHDVLGILRKVSPE